MATTSKGKTGGATGTSAAKAKPKDAEEAEPQPENTPATDGGTPESTPTPDTTPEPVTADGGTKSDGDGNKDSSDAAPEPVGRAAALTGTPHAAAAPMTPPNNEAGRATWPVMGRLDSSNDPVAANAALRSPSGTTHMKLVGENGSTIALDEIFDFPDSGSASMVATVTQRVYLRFRYPNTITPTTILLYPAGAIVPIPEALRVQETYQYAPSDEIPTGS